MGDESFMVCMGKGCRFPASEVEGNVCPNCRGDLVEEGGFLARVREETRKLVREEEHEMYPLDVRMAEKDPDNRFGDFVLVQIVGEGGFGSVYKAWQKKLKRYVALKFLHVEKSGTVLARFKREAQTAAALSHPNIVRLYEVGEEAGKHYIAMEFIEGTSLENRGLKPREATRVVRDISLAVQYAHDLRIIHRDLKPGNIMSDALGHVWVMDFGLARRMDHDLTLTRDGAVMGTPSFMSPEQASGQKIDTSSDIYSLGATLYALLSGDPPFQGNSIAELMTKISRDEPVDLRKTKEGIHADLGTIVMKCLERDPARRYLTAGELAEDLSRYLEGDLIEARPASTMYRFRKRILKVKGIAATAAISAVLLLGIGALVVGVLLPQLREKEGEIERKEGELEEKDRELVEQMRRTVSSSLNAAIWMRRSGRVREMRELLPEVEGACAQVMQRAPNLAEPHYHLGRMYRAMMRYEDALREQSVGVNKDPADVRCRYERGVLLVRKYGTLIEELRTTWWQRQGVNLLQEGERDGVEAPSPTQLEDEEAREVRSRATEDFLAVMGRSGDIGAGKGFCGKGLLAYTQERYREAISFLEKAVSLAPELEVAYEILGEIALVRKDAATAILWTSKGYDRDQGYLSHLEVRSRAYQLKALQAARTKEDPDSWFRKAIGDLERVEKMDPSRANTWSQLGQVRISWANDFSLRGKDALPIYLEVEEDFNHAIHLDPMWARSWLNRGLVHLAIGGLLFNLGRDPEEAFRKGEVDFGRALSLESGLSDALAARANIRTNLALYYSRTGRDPDTLLSSARADLDEAIRLHPGMYRFWYSRGMNSATGAGTRQMRGEDVGTLLEEAESDLKRALKIQPSNAFVFRALGQVFFQKASVSSLDPDKRTSLYKVSVEYYGRALKSNPNWGEAWKGRGVVLHHLGKSLPAGATEKSVYFSRARDDLRKALGLYGNLATIWRLMGDLFLSWGADVARRKQDPSDKLRQAYDAYSESLKRNPDQAKIWEARASLQLSRGTLALGSGRDPGEYYEGAIADATRTIELSPAASRAFRIRGAALCRRAAEAYKKKKFVPEDLERGIQDLLKASEIDPGSVDPGRIELMKDVLRKLSEEMEE